MSVTTEYNAVLKSFEPRRDHNDDHKTWSKDGKNYFEFNVVLTKSDGTDETGAMSSTNTSPTWKVGNKMVKYGRAVMTNDHGTFISYRSVNWEKQEGARSGGGGGKRPLTREERSRINRQVCLECAQNAIVDLNYMERIKDMKAITGVAFKFLEFTHFWGEDNNNREITLSNSLRRSIEGLQMTYMVDEFVYEGCALNMMPRKTRKQDRDGVEVDVFDGWMVEAKHIMRYAFKSFIFSWYEKPTPELVTDLYKKYKEWEQSKGY